MFSFLGFGTKKKKERKKKKIKKKGMLKEVLWTEGNVTRDLDLCNGMKSTRNSKNVVNAIFLFFNLAMPGLSCGIQALRCSMRDLFP